MIKDTRRNVVTKKKKEYYLNDLPQTLAALKDAKKIVIEVELDGENYHKSSIIGIGLIIDQEVFI